MSDKPDTGYWPNTKRVMTAQTISRDITAHQLAMLMQVSVTYTDAALDAMDRELLDLVMRNSKAI